jgi:hypothetical protein
MRIFAESELRQLIEGNTNRLRDEIEAQNDDYLLNVNQQTFVDYLVSKYSIENLTLKFEEVTISKDEREIPVERFPRDFYFHSQKKCKRPVIRYHLPFEGDAQLLRLEPNTHYSWSLDVDIEDRNVCFEIVSFGDDPQEIKREADQILSSIRNQAENVQSEVDSYNKRLPQDADQLFQNRKQIILKSNDLISALGVPIRKRSDVPSTFSVPTPQISKRISVSKPIVKEPGYKPEPALDESTYREILQIIHDVGRQFERMPSTYSGKSEEELRDHFLLYLEPRFEGSATGETFNKSGKTDILLRYEGSNVFIAECKFWKGAKSYSKTIDQLLGYLTWRDSKAAIIIFVQTADFSSVLNQIEPLSRQHPNHLGFESQSGETWFNFRFHIKDDSNREIRLAVLLFHIPHLTKEPKDGGGS